MTLKRAAAKWSMRSIWTCGWVVLLTAGCGSASSSLGSGATGLVTIDGKPLTTGTVQFVAAEGANLPSAVGVIGPDGRYSAKANQSVQGLAPGKYVVTVVSWSKEPDSAANVVGVSAIPEKYNDPTTSGFVVTVEKGKTATFDVKMVSGG